MANVIKKGAGLVVIFLVIIINLVVFSFISAAQNSDSILDKVAVLSSQEKYDQARQELEQAVEQGYTDFEIINSLVQIYNKLYLDYHKSEEMLENIILAKPADWKFYNLLGRTLLVKGEPEKAIIYLQKAIELYRQQGDSWDHSLANIYYDLANSYLQSGKIKLTIKALEITMQNDPFHLKGGNLLHRLYVENEDYQKAYQIWRKNYQVYPGQQDPEKFQNWDKLYREGLETKGDNRHLKMGLVYRKLLLYAEAQAEFSKALKISPDNKVAADHLKEISLFLEFRQELKTFFEDYYRRRNLKGAEEERGIYHRLFPIYQKIAPLFPETKNLLTKYWIDQLNEEIEKQFSVKIKIYKANGALVCSGGSVVSRHQSKVSLWGEEVTLSVLILKDMFSNGRLFWWNDGEAGIGGWNSSNKSREIIVIADQSYLISSTYNLYHEKKQGLEGAENIYSELLSKKPLNLYFSQQIQNRFFIKDVELRLNQFSSKDTPTTEDWQQVCLSFLETNYKTALLTHEGQHAFDGLSGKYYLPYELEYRAKLAELIFGNQQFLTLSNLYNASISGSGSTSHGRAEKRLFKEIVTYLKDQNEEYPEIDITKNILAQLPNLSVEEIRSLAESIF